MTDDQIVSFVTRLHSRTLAGKIAWQETLDPDTFKAEIGGYEVGVGQFTSFDPEVGEESTEYKILIFDANGREIDTFFPWGSYFKGLSMSMNFRETYESARRSARGVDTALLSILSAFEQADLDDEIPF